MANALLLHRNPRFVTDAGIPRGRSGRTITDAGIPRGRSGRTITDAGIPRGRSRRTITAAIKCVAATTMAGARDALVRMVQRSAQGEDYPQADEAILRAIGGLDLRVLLTSAAAIRDTRLDSNIVTFSPKAFIPLTRACRDSCGYCTFAQAPKPGKSVYLSLDEVLSIASRAAELGCSEALFTLGDKPELLYPQAQEELSSLGHSTTVGYVAEAAKLVLEKTGLLPHINGGVMSKEDVKLLRKVSASQGLMLESTASSLAQPGGPHFNCPDKDPSARIETMQSRVKRRYLLHPACLLELARQGPTGLRA